VNFRELFGIRGVFFSLELVFVSVLLITNTQSLSSLNFIAIVQQKNIFQSTSLTAAKNLQSYDHQAYLPFIQKGMPGYFVSTSGSDTNPGTLVSPWRTIQHAAEMARPGDTIYIRSGIYHEAIFISNGGTASYPIRYQAFPGEKPVIDGEGNLPPWSEALFTLYEEAEYVEISGLEIRNSTYNGVLSWGSHVLLDNLYVHHTQSTGILAIGNYSVIQNCRVYRSNMNNEYGVLPSNWGAGIEIVGIDGTITQNGVIRNCTAWENWGEGINIHNTNNVTVEDNIVHDSFSTNIYISDATNALVQRNFVYTDPASYFFGYGAQVGIMMGDETYSPPTQDITIINNIAYGNRQNFYWWKGSQGGGLVNVLIANNAFVNSVDNSGVKINQGNHMNSRFINNIIEQDNSLPLIDIIETNPGLLFSNNLWSKTPDPYASGSGDVIGDPRLAGTPGFSFAPEAFMLTYLSPAINKALSRSEVTNDFFKNYREALPDIGAHEYTVAP
jgi:hypothetical protein